MGGFDKQCQCSGVPQLSQGEGFVAIAAGRHHSLALTSNGNVVGWGPERDHECSGAPSLGEDEEFVRAKAEPRVICLYLGEAEALQTSIECRDVGGRVVARVAHGSEIQNAKDLSATLFSLFGICIVALLPDGRTLHDLEDLETFSSMFGIVDAQ